MRKDTLAAGARSAKFAGGVGEGSGPSVMSDDDRAKLEAETAAVIVEKTAAPKKIFRPLGRFILVRRVTVEELSNVLITDTIEKEKPAEGTVIVTGPKVVDVRVGDRVVFGKYAGTEFKLNGETLLIMEDDCVQGVIEDEALPISGCTNFGGLTIARA